jgi:hypothetical protein
MLRSVDAAPDRTNGASGFTIPFLPHSNGNTPIVARWMMQSGDAETVGRHLRDALSHPPYTGELVLCPS